MWHDLTATETYEELDHHKTQDTCATNNTQIYGELTAHTILIVQMGMGTGKLYRHHDDETCIGTKVRLPPHS